MSLTSAYTSTAQQPLHGYDIIILGAGCAGLSLVMRLLDDQRTASMRILLIDKDAKKTNDRTWCYWEAGPGAFDSLLVKQWSSLDFYSNAYSGALNIAPYTYKMIRGEDFYRHCLGRIAQHPSITFVQDEVLSFTAQRVELTQGTVDCGGALVFSSIYKPGPQKPGRHYLLQHFKGWMVQTGTPVFDSGRATLMDFRVGQEQGAAFVYVMPFSATRALVEYTLFTPQLLEQEQYDAALKDYLERFLQAGSWQVTETEFGVIPMTSEPMPQQQNGVYLLGTAGGQTKASTGYTFRFIQKQAAAVAARIAAGRAPVSRPSIFSSRFRLYDNTLLRILAKQKLPGDEVFARLFRRNSAAAIFRFLDNETTLLQELKIMSTVQQYTFMQAAFAEMLRIR